MPSGFQNWSVSAASNATADSAINWAEGQLPSTVNDSARAVMAVLAKWRDDNNGSITTGGTSTAYTLTTNTVFTTLALLANQTLSFTMSATSGATPTLNVDGLGAKVIRNATGVALPTGALLSGSVYHVTYNNSSTEFLLQNQPGVLPASIVSTAAIADDAVTYAKIQNLAASRLLGNPTGGQADTSEISVGAGLAFSGTSLIANPSTGLTAALAVDYATKAEQQTATSAVKTVNPLHQLDHPSAAKAWAHILNTTALVSSYGVSGVVRSSAGVFVVSFSTAFTANPCCTATAYDASVPLVAIIGAVGTSSITVVIRNSTTGTATDPTLGFAVQCFGSQ